MYCVFPPEFLGNIFGRCFCSKLFKKYFSGGVLLCSLAMYLGQLYLNFVASCLNFPSAGITGLGYHV